MIESIDTEAMQLEADARRNVGDEKGAFELLSRAAALGDTSAYCSLGYFYGEGIGVAKNVRREMRWYQRAWRAGREIVACSNIAVLHAQAGNRKLAEFWWRKRVAQHDGDAALELARLLLLSRRPWDIARAIRLLNRAVACQPWLQISLASQEEAQELLLQLKRSRRVALKSVAEGWRAQSRR